MSTSSGNLIARRLGVLRTTRPPDRLTIRLPPYCLHPLTVLISCTRRQRDQTAAGFAERRRGGVHCPEETVLPDIDNWINWLTIDKSQATVAGYAYELRRLARDFPDKQPADFTPQDLQRYLAGRRAAGCGDATIRHAVNALRSFFAYHHSPAAATLPLPRPNRKIQRTLSFEQALAVMAACNTSSIIGKRDLALAALMLDTGLRSREVCRLKL